MIKKTPLLFALSAAGYIGLIILLIQLFSQVLPKEDTLLIPLVMLSLFVLSAAVMGFLFVFEPLRMYLDGQKQDAVKFFGKTVGYFACCVVVFVILLLTLS